jgi:predicted outer membrane lipoprotein
MEINNRKDFYEKLYFYELDFREKLESRLKLPMTAFAILTAMALFLFDDNLKEKTNELSCIFLVIYIAGCLMLLLSIFFFIRSWYGYTYKMLPNAVVIENYYQDMYAHYNDLNKEKSKEWTNDKFDEYLLTTFRDYAAFNTVNNDKKSYNLYLSNTAMLISLALLFVAYYPYYSLV